MQLVNPSVCHLSGSVSLRRQEEAAMALISRRRKWGR